MGRTKKYTAFLSFADPDRDLAESLHTLFLHLDHQTYFAPRVLLKTGSPEWRSEIIKGVHSSCCFVPILTRHSIQRPWVLYESGIADSFNLKRYPARVSSVSISDIEYLPSPGVLVFDLFVKESLIQFVASVCMSRRDQTRPDVTARVREAVMSAPDLVKKIINLSKTRWVFIAGNSPNVEKQLRAQVPWFTSKPLYEARLKDFVTILTETLLDNGFSISACPQVPSVGLNVINTAAHYIASRSYTEPLDYRISGIYPIDRDTRASNLSEMAKKQWLSHIMVFRQSYLQDQEWLILIGGNAGTREEYLAAKQCKVKIVPIPCFGGSAQALWDQEVPDKKNPCKSCTTKDGSCGKKCIDDIIRFIKEKAL